MSPQADLINLLSMCVSRFVPRRSCLSRAFPPCSIERVIHSVLTARIILDLRQLGTRRGLGLSTFSAGVWGARSAVDDVEFAHSTASSGTRAEASTAADSDTIA